MINFNILLFLGMKLFGLIDNIYISVTEIFGFEYGVKFKYYYARNFS